MDKRNIYRITTEPVVSLELVVPHGVRLVSVRTYILKPISKWRRLLSRLNRLELVLEWEEEVKG